MALYFFVYSFDNGGVKYKRYTTKYSETAAFVKNAGSFCICFRMQLCSSNRDQCF